MPDPLKRLDEIRTQILALKSEAQGLFDHLRREFESIETKPASTTPPAPVPKSAKASAKPPGRRRRSRSPSGPLAPAVIAALQKAGKPLRTAEIFEALKNSGYQFTGTDPKKSLGAGLYNMSGIKRLGDGLFTVETAAPAAPAVPAEAAPVAA